MTTVIVPVDFSDTSLHAARYAAQLLVGHYGVTILLYHSYSKPAEAESTKENLEALKAALMKDHIVKIETLAHQEEDFVDGLERAARHRNASLVIMGITGKSALAQVFFGSNTLKMAERKVCPVLIVPENAPFTPIENVMLTSDFKNTHNSTPSVPIKDFLSAFNPQLHVVNVDKDHYISLTENYENEKQELKKMFAEYKPEFYFMRLFDVDEAINMFAEKMSIDLIIAVQKNHSFIEKMLRGSRTKTLTYHTKVPILVMHEYKHACIF
jgi:nucleotide-binding universal stress UspA family protein